MDCALWLNKHKIYSADEIPEYPDIAALRGYYLGGSLEKWLREHNGEAYADKLARLDCDDNGLNNALAEIFGGSAAPMLEMRGELSETELPRNSPCSGAYDSSYGSYRAGSFRFGSLREWEWFLRGGFFGSYRLGSLRLGSFHEWEWEWLFRQFSSGSYRLGSFRRGSFHEWEWLFRQFSAGSYRLGSFRFGSFGSYKGFPLDGGSAADRLWREPDEYDRIMFLNLVNCPLNRYGYGIHNI